MSHFSPRRRFRLVGLLGIAGIVLGSAGCDRTVDAAAQQSSPESAPPALENDLQKASYLIGYNQAATFRTQTQEAADMQAYAAGVADSVAGEDSRVAGDPNQYVAALQSAVQARVQAASAAVVEAGNQYRETYAAKDGVTALPSGLLYEVITEGDGPKPTADDTVTTHYHGQLVDGTVFDSSVQRGEPASFPVGGVIAGWTEALQLMPVGSKWRLVIPPELAYGERPAGRIPPNSTLIFEVELLSIE